MVLPVEGEQTYGGLMVQGRDPIRESGDIENLAQLGRRGEATQEAPERPGVRPARWPDSKWPLGQKASAAAAHHEQQPQAFGGELGLLDYAVADTQQQRG